MLHIDCSTGEIRVRGMGVPGGVCVGGGGGGAGMKRGGR